MSRTIRWISRCILVAMAFSSGCKSNSNTENGALFGGLFGAGTGALIGSATGHPGAGAAIGAGVGALSGAAIGSSIDKDEARNRALIEAQLGRQAPTGAVTIPEVLTMNQAKVKDELIVNHIRAHGLAAPLTTNDLITLQQAGVSAQVVQTMQSTPVAQGQQPKTVVIRESDPPPVIVEGYWGPGWHHHPHPYYW